MALDNTLISPADIIKDLQRYMAEDESLIGWRDYFEGGAGQTIIELIAASQAIKSHAHYMRIRESSLRYAKLDSSVTELAINKGVYRPTASNLLTKIYFTNNHLSSSTVTTGQIIGSYKDYKVFSTETKTLSVGMNTLEVLVAHRVTKEIVINTDTSFIKQEFTFDDMFIGSTYEELSAGPTKVNLVSHQLNIYNDLLKTSCIRMVSKYKSEIYFGDGIIGLKPTGDQSNVSYTCYTFNEDLLGDVLLKNFNFFDADLYQVDSFDIMQPASPYMSKEELRRIAIRSTVDGRWVQGLDYENGLIKEFYNEVDDIYAEDAYPAENLVILPTGSASDYLKERIQTLVNNKKGNAVLVNYVWIDPTLEENYIDIDIQMEYYGTDSDTVINKVISEYQGLKENVITRNDSSVSPADIAIELTQNLPNGKMYPVDITPISINKYQFIKNLNITYTELTK